MTKIKLLESRVSIAHGCQQAGTVIDVDDAAAERSVALFQAEFDGNPERTAEVRARSPHDPVIGQGEKPGKKPKKSQPRTAKKTKADPKLADVTNLKELDLDEKVIVLLMTEDESENAIPAFESIDQLQSFITGGGDLSLKSGIGGVTKTKIELALLEYKFDDSDGDDSDEDDFDDDDDDDVDDEDDDLDDDQS